MGLYTAHVTLSHTRVPEQRVMKVNLSEGDRVVFEDDSSVLANESILMRGLVVRSRGNQLSVRFHSAGLRSGTLLLRYQGIPPPSHGTGGLKLGH
uniref:Uncharacterized protein n=1 Tax=Knipowitschia caucasica TaxID=637954 RepID=A0AAV2J6K1_KNICA